VALTEEAYKKAEYNSTDDKAPVPRVIVTHKRNAEKHEDDAVACCTAIQQCK